MSNNGHANTTLRPKDNVRFVVISNDLIWRVYVVTVTKIIYAASLTFLSLLDSQKRVIRLINVPNLAIH